MYMKKHRANMAFPIPFWAKLTKKANQKGVSRTAYIIWVITDFWERKK